MKSRSRSAGISAAAGDEAGKVIAARRLAGHIVANVKRPAEALGAVDQRGMWRQRVKDYRAAGLHWQRACTTFIEEPVRDAGLFLRAMRVHLRTPRHHLQAAVLQRRVGDGEPHRHRPRPIDTVNG